MREKRRFGRELRDMVCFSIVLCSRGGPCRVMFSALEAEIKIVKSYRGVFGAERRGVAGARGSKALAGVRDLQWVGKRVFRGRCHKIASWSMMLGAPHDQSVELTSLLQFHFAWHFVCLRRAFKQKAQYF